MKEQNRCPYLQIPRTEDEVCKCSGYSVGMGGGKRVKISRKMFDFEFGQNGCFTPEWESCSHVVLLRRQDEPLWKKAIRAARTMWQVDEEKERLIGVDRLVGGLAEKEELSRIEDEMMIRDLRRGR